MRGLVTVVVAALVPATLAAQSEETRSLFSVTFGGMLFTHEYAAGFGFTITGSASVRVARPLMLGVTVTEWGRLVGDGTSCGITTRRCVLRGNVGSMSTFGLATVYPFGTRLVRGRLGLGFSYLRERVPSLAFQLEMIETRAWPFTMLIGLGSDIRIGGQIFLAPTLDLLLVPSYEPQLLEIPKLVLFIGVGMTGG